MTTLVRLALTAAAVACLAAAPAATPNAGAQDERAKRATPGVDAAVGVKPTAKSAAKPAVKTKASPKKTPAVKVVATPISSPTPDEPAVMDGERALATGEASWTLGKDAVKSSEVQGTIQTSGGFKIATITFPNGKKEKLQIGFMYTGPGPVDQGYLTSVFAVDGDGRYHAWKKGVGTCDVNLAKATALEVEGTMTCAKGLLDMENKPAKPIVDVKFKAKADSAGAVKTPAP